jgi:hypothetical protein
VPDEVCHGVFGFYRCCRGGRRRELLRLGLERALYDFFTSEVKEDIHGGEGKEGLVDAE